MPVMDGFEATRAMRDFERAQVSARTPIFALTAQVAGTDEEAWNDAGADGHILKPFTLDKLSSVLGGISFVSHQGRASNEASEESDVLNLATVQTLEQLGSEHGVVRDRIWNMFFDKAPDMIETLQTAVEAGEPKEISSRAHALKSMALSAGFKAISDFLQTLEEQAKQEPVSSLPDLSTLSVLVDRTQQQTTSHKQLAA